VLIAQSSKNHVLRWVFTYAENCSTWLQLCEEIPSFPFAIVCDGKKGMIKAIKLRWPGVIIQRCQFHVIHQVNILLTKNPETLAALQFKRIVGNSVRVKTRDDLKTCRIEYINWFITYPNISHRKDLSGRTHTNWTPKMALHPRQMARCKFTPQTCVSKSFSVHSFSRNSQHFKQN